MKKAHLIKTINRPYLVWRKRCWGKKGWMQSKDKNFAYVVIKWQQEHKITGHLTENLLVKKMSLVLQSKEKHQTKAVTNNSLHWFPCWCQKNILKSLPEPKVPSQNFLFYSTNSPKAKDIQFTIMEDKEEQQICTFEKLEPTHFFFKMFAWKTTQRMTTSVNNDLWRGWYS